MIDVLAKVVDSVDYTCGSGSMEIPGMLPHITSTIVLIIQIFVPIALVIFGMLDLGKAVIAQKEDEIKKGQATFLKRLLAGVIVFFVVFIVKIVVKFATNNDENIANCVYCFISGEVSSNNEACTPAALSGSSTNGSM